MPIRLQKMALQPMKLLTLAHRSTLINSTWIIAIFATIGLVVMVVLTVVALRRGLKGKGEIHQLTTTEAPAQNTERKAENDIENSNGYASGTAFQNPDQSKQ